MGRPKVQIDWNKVDGMLKAHCNGTEIAAYFGINPETLYDRCKEDHKMGFTEYSQQKKSVGTAMLKVKQFEVAYGNKNTPPNLSMLIWLGKQYLDQADKREDKGSEDKQPRSIKVQIVNSVQPVTSEDAIVEPD